MIDMIKSIFAPLFALPWWISVPIMWLVSGLIGKGLLELLDLAKARGGQRDFIIRNLKGRERNLDPILWGLLTFIPSLLFALANVRSILGALRNKGHPAKNKPAVRSVSAREPENPATRRTFRATPPPEAPSGEPPPSPAPRPIPRPTPPNAPPTRLAQRPPAPS